MGDYSGSRPMKLASHKLAWVAALAVTRRPAVFAAPHDKTGSQLLWEGASARDDSNNLTRVLQRYPAALAVAVEAGFEQGHAAQGVLDGDWEGGLLTDGVGNALVIGEVVTR